MDILSDVNLVGNLTVSKNLKARYVCATNGISSDSINIGYSTSIGSNTYFGNSVTFMDSIIWMRRGLQESFSCVSSNIVNEISVDVPSGCKRFVINSYLLENVTDSTGQSPSLIHPIVSAWCGVNKVEIDLELCFTNVNNSPSSLTEILIGNVVSCSSNRKLNITII